MSFLDDLGSTALSIPQAIGGGALDVLIGDRTNVTPAEQAKRVVQALLLSGDHGQNLLALQQLNAKGDAANQKGVSSPEFQNAVGALMRQGVPSDQAFQKAAQQYGISGYAPDYGAQDMPPDASGKPSPSYGTQAPLLPPPSAEAQVKYLKAQTQVGAMQNPDPLEAVRARYAAAGVPLPTAIQRAISERQLPTTKAGIETRNLTYNPDGTISATVNELPLQQRFYTNDAVGQAQADLDIALTNKAAMQAGVPDRLVKAFGPDGIGVQKVTDPFTAPLATAAVGEFAQTHDPRIFDIYNRVAQPNGGPPPPEAPAVPGAPTVPARSGPPLSAATVATGAPASGGPPLLSRVERAQQEKVQTELRSLQEKYPEAVTEQPDGTLARNPAFKGTAAAAADAKSREVKAKASADATSNMTVANGALDLLDALGPTANLQPDQFEPTVMGYLGSKAYGLLQHFRAQNPNVQGNAALSAYDGAVQAVTVPLFRALGDKGFRNFEAIKLSAQGVVPSSHDVEPVRVIKQATLRNMFSAMNNVPNGDDAAAASVMQQQLASYAEQIAALDRGEVPQSAPASAPSAAPTARATPAPAATGAIDLGKGYAVRMH